MKIENKQKKNAGKSMKKKKIENRDKNGSPVDVKALS